MWSIQTERLTLIELQHNDAEFIVQLLNEPTFINNIADKGVRSIEDAIKYLEEGPITSYQNNGFGLWKVLLRETNARIGMCGLIKRDTLEDVDLGYALSPEFVGKGYAQEATTAVLKYAKENLPLQRIVAIVSPGNQRSITLLHKLGFRYEKMISFSASENVALYGITI